MDAIEVLKNIIEITDLNNSLISNKEIEIENLEVDKSAIQCYL